MTDSEILDLRDDFVERKFSCGQDYDEVDFIGFARAILAAAPVAQQEPWYERIEGMEVSMDVSTGEHDAYNRVYGRVSEVMLANCGNGVDTILAVEESRNFKDTAPEAAK